MTLVVDDIGILVTNDPTVGDGPLGILRDAALVIDGTSVVAVEKAGASADERVSAEGRCVIPGFVDSHTHLVFAGDRSDEFAARMAGTPYSAGGIATTVAATRAASTAELAAAASARRHAALLAGTTHVEIKSGYGLDVEHERRLVEIASGITDDVTFLGAHTVPPEHLDDVGAYVDLVCGEMLSACSPFAKWIDVFCEIGAFDVDESRQILRAGRAAGLGLRVHANQLGPGPGVQLAAEEGAASADHCTYLSDDDVDALAASDTVATFLPASDFSTRQRYPDARRALDAGVTVALASNCNPGSSYTSSMSFCIALAVRDMHMMPEEAVWAATRGGALALRQPELGWLGRGSRADAVILDAPTYIHLASRPGMALARAVIAAGELAR